MRAVLTNFGSTGSVYPFISLARELQARGHEAVVALPPFFSSWVDGFGLRFVPIGPDLREIQYAINEAMLHLPDSEDGIRTMFAPLMPALPQMFHELMAVCDDADVLVSGPWQPASRMVHELTGIPWVTVQNSHFGGTGTPEFQRATAGLINPCRAQFGLPPIDNPLTHDANSPQLVIYNMSREVRPPSPNWPAHYHMPGYLFLDDERWEPDAELAAFIAGGPPVVFTFGSMTHGDPAVLMDLLLQAIALAGCRAMIQHGWSGLTQDRCPPQVHVGGFVPHDWLFPRAACVVHHGGAGTAASVFRAGVPSVFVPHSFDHPLWAELAAGLGCAPSPIPYTELEPARLACAVREALGSRTCREAASALGRRIRAEQGLSRAGHLIEALVERASARTARAQGWR